LKDEFEGVGMDAQRKRKRVESFIMTPPFLRLDYGQVVALRKRTV